MIHSRRVCELLLVAVVTLLPEVAEAGGWRHYQNARYGESLDYPSDQLAALPEPDAGDGTTFRAIHGKAGAAVWAGFAVEQNDFAAAVREAEHKCAGGRATYKIQRTTKGGLRLMAVSCPLPSTAIYYTKAFQCRDVITQLDISYPKAEAAIWGPIVAKMSASLGAGCGTD